MYLSKKCKCQKPLASHDDTSHQKFYHHEEFPV